MDAVVKLSFVDQMQACIRDRSNLIAIANACDRAYAVGTGNPDWHTPFGEESPEKVAQNLAGMQAVVSSVCALCALRNLSLEQHGLSVLQQIANGNLMSEEIDLVLRFANATWGAGQPFRTDKGPLGRAISMNVFDDLPPSEVLKDMHQIRAAANFFIQKLGG